MDRLPPELCLAVMEVIPNLLTLGNFIFSTKLVFRVFSSNRARVLRSVIKNQFGTNARDALFLASGQASGATSEATRLQTIQHMHRLSWTEQDLDSKTLCRLIEVGRAVDDLSSIFADTMASEFWVKAVDDKPPSSFHNAELGMRRTLYRYWILCEVYSNFSPSRQCFFWSSRLDRSPFEEFYRPLSTRELLEMAFFEFCFFPHYMKDVCVECKGETCDGQSHKLVFRGGPEELLRIRSVDQCKQPRRSSCANEDQWRCKGLLQDLLHGISIVPAGPLPGPCDDSFLYWVMFELDGLDEPRRSTLALVCGAFDAE